MILVQAHMTTGNELGLTCIFRASCGRTRLSWTVVFWRRPVLSLKTKKLTTNILTNEYCGTSQSCRVGFVYLLLVVGVVGSWLFFFFFFFFFKSQSLDNCLPFLTIPASKHLRYRHFWQRIRPCLAAVHRLSHCTWKETVSVVLLHRMKKLWKPDDVTFLGIIKKSGIDFLFRL